MDERKKIIIDCDSGIDDAVAIAMALASSKVLLLGITTVAGNRDIDKTTANTLRTLEYFGRTDIPVYMGSNRPLERELFVPGLDSPHGKDGFGDCDIAAASTIARQGAVEFMKHTVESNRGEVTIIALGPLTNVALMLEALDDVKSVEHIYAASGAFGVPGNMTDAAEFTAFVDPEAARTVFESGVPLRVAGLDVANAVSISRNEFYEFGKMQTPQARFFSTTHRWAVEKDEKSHYSFFADSIPFAWFLDNRLVAPHNGKIEVVIDGNERGRTNFTEGEGTIEVGFEVDSKLYFRYFRQWLETGAL